MSATEILVIHPDTGEESCHAAILGQEIAIRRIGCDGDPSRAKAIIAAYDGRVGAIALERMPIQLQLGHTRQQHRLGAELAAAAHTTPVVDGSGIRASLERWGVLLADRAQPGIWSQKRILMVPGLNHEGLAQALQRSSSTIRYADPLVFFALPQMPGVGSPHTLEQAATPTIEELKDAPFRRIVPGPGQPHVPRASAAFEWADVLAGDIGAIRRYAPARLAHKTVVVDCANEQDLDDLRERGVSIAITLMPSLDAGTELGRWPAAVIEAILVALRPNPAAEPTEDTYLNMIAELRWTPAIRYLQPQEAAINQFAFVIHPLSMDDLHHHPAFGWTRHLPDALVEPLAAYAPVMQISRVTGACSPTTGQRVEGVLLGLGATPRAMMRHKPQFTYDRLNQAAHMAERLGARIMGLGAFTSVVGDAGITVAHEADIAITSGNSLTVAATLEAAKQAAIKMGITDLTRGKAMVIGATGSIGSVCARLLAQAVYDVVLVSVEPERLLSLKDKIQAETPQARVTIATSAEQNCAECDVIVTATSAFGQRILDISQCKPGAIICDVARPPDINKAEADLRPDVLVIESGEVLIPGDVSFGYDIGLPPKVAYACLAETTLLAMEGRFEDYTLGRDITIERVKEIYRLSQKHGFTIAGLRSFGRYLTDADIAEKRTLAERLRADPELLARTKAEAAAKLAAIPRMSKGVRDGQGKVRRGVAWGMLGLGLTGLIVARWQRHETHHHKTTPAT